MTSNKPTEGVREVLRILTELLAEAVLEEERRENQEKAHGRDQSKQRFLGR